MSRSETNLAARNRDVLLDRGRAALLELVVSMQVINDVGKMSLSTCGRESRSAQSIFDVGRRIRMRSGRHRFAIAFANDTLPDCALILAVLAAGMLISNSMH